jgi:hypothetical protein
VRPWFRTIVPSYRGRTDEANLGCIGSRLISLIYFQSFKDFSPPNKFLGIYYGQSGSDEHLSGFHVVGALVQQRHGLHYRVGEEHAYHRIAPLVAPDLCGRRTAL